MEENIEKTSANPGGESTDEDKGRAEGTDEHEAFARSILKEPENREKILFVLEFFSRKPRGGVAAIFQQLAGEKLGSSFEARALVTLYSMVHGAEYPEFMNDLCHTTRVLMRLGAGATASGMIFFGLKAFGTCELDQIERKYVADFLRTLREDFGVGISGEFRDVMDAYFNDTLEPNIQWYRNIRLGWLEKLRGKPSWRARWPAYKIFALASAASLSAALALQGIPMLSATTSTTEEVSEEVREQGLQKDQRAKKPREILKENQPPAQVQPQPPPPSLAQSIPLAQAICSQAGGERGLQGEKGLPAEEKTVGFRLGERQVRVICGAEEGEPFLEIAERIPPNGAVAERVTLCRDDGLDDTPDNCGASTGPGQPPIKMTGPPRAELDAWFQNALRDVAGGMKK